MIKHRTKDYELQQELDAEQVRCSHEHIMPRRDFLKVSALVAALAGMKYFAPKALAPFIPRDIEQIISGKIQQLDLLPPVSGHSGIELYVPETSIIPNVDDPFADATWKDAAKKQFTQHSSGGVNISTKNPYIYAKYAPGISKPSVFFYLDGVYQTDRKKTNSGALMFDTQHDNKSNTDKWTDVDDFAIGIDVSPSAQPPYGKLIGYPSDNGWYMQGLTARWDFGKSENSNENHCKFYIEVPLETLRKYPNQKEPNRLGFNSRVNAMNPDFTNEVANLSENEVGFADMILTQKLALTTTPTSSATNTAVPPITSERTTLTSLATQSVVSPQESPSTEIINGFLKGGAIGVAALAGIYFINRMTKRKDSIKSTGS